MGQKYNVFIGTFVAYAMIGLLVMYMMNSSDNQQSNYNLNECVNDPSKDQHLCYVWAEDITDYGEQIAATTIFAGGGAAIYTAIRMTDTKMKDSLIKRLAIQTHRFKDHKPPNYIVVISNDQWIGSLTNKCQECYDAYMSAVKEYNSGQLEINALQQSANNLYDAIKIDYDAAVKETET